MKKLFFLLFFIPAIIFAAPMFSPTWGFYADLPEGYIYIDGDLYLALDFSVRGKTLTLTGKYSIVYKKHL